MRLQPGQQEPELDGCLLDGARQSSAQAAVLAPLQKHEGDSGPHSRHNYVRNELSLRIHRLATNTVELVQIEQRQKGLTELRSVDARWRVVLRICKSMPSGAQSRCTTRMIRAAQMHSHT
jgi:hypothetical protein